MKIIEKFKDKINGVLTAFDRMIIKGHILQLFSDSGKRYFLSQENILLKDYGDYAERVTKSIKASIEEKLEKTGRPLIYLSSSRTSKEGTAQDVLKRDPIEEGLICIISTLEMSPSVEIRKNKETQKLELKNGERKCLHYYFYYLDKEFGFMHVKLQSWFPFGIQVYVNGREYISKQLDKAGISYKRYDNCFTQIDDVEVAQAISDDFTGKKLDGMLNHFARQVNPFIERIKEVLGHDYYWCMEQCEYATDVMFNSREDLESVYMDFVEHGIVNFKYTISIVMQKLSGTLTNRYIRGINLISSDNETVTNKTYFLYNGHGYTVQLTDATGNVIKSYDYDAFGNDTNVFRYSGEYFDKELGEYYLRARYYDPEIGRFITEDSVFVVRSSKIKLPNGIKLRDPLSLNLYTYCSNNPVLCFLRGTIENIVSKQQQIGIKRACPNLWTCSF